MPALSGRIVDGAEILSTEAETRLTALLAALERETSDQLVVVTIADLAGEPISDLGLRLGNGWGIGQRHLDNGVLLIIAPNERQVRIEVGCGLEGLLTDRDAAGIVADVLIARIRRGNYEQGAEAGVEAITAILRRDRARPKPRMSGR